MLSLCLQTENIDMNSDVTACGSSAVSGEPNWLVTSRLVCRLTREKVEAAGAAVFLLLC